jgi:hypothetical protein|eukprot:g3759.t1
MKLLIVLLAVLLALASAHNIRRAATGGATGVSEGSAETGASEAEQIKAAGEAAASADESKAHAATIKIMEESDATWAKVGKTCAKEESSTKDWLANPIVNVPKMTKRRLAAEKKLLAALLSRVEGLKNFIKRIKVTRKRLRERIVSVNALFKLKFDENMANVEAATVVLTDIGHLKLVPYNPKLVKIKNFKCIKCENLALIEETKTALAAASQTCAEKDECSGATKIAFKAYRKGLELNKAMGVNFEKERKILAGMRDQIRKLIDQKQHKLNQLLAQIERIKGAMADDDYDAAKKSLSEHLQIVGKSCAGMTTFAKQEKGALEKVLSAMENKGELHKGAGAQA